MKAAEEFSRIFYQDPGNKITPQAELMQAYSLFLACQYEEAVDVLDTFIKLHPMHEDIAYAYYLKALSYYMQVSNVQLDQSRTFLAKESFEDVIKLFPKTKYSIDASLKIDLVNDHLAGKEMDVGRYYLHKNLSHFFNDELPENSYLQFLLVANHDVEDILGHWQKMRNNSDPLCNVIGSLLTNATILDNSAFAIARLKTIATKQNNFFIILDSHI